MEPNLIIHGALKSLEHLIGKWISIKGEGKFPTISPFSYNEVIEFESVGQPMLNFTSNSYNPTNSKPMHKEKGFLRIKPGTDQVALILAHNFGLSTIEEGTIKDDVISLKSTHINRISFAKEPTTTIIERTFAYCKEDETLDVLIKMATTKTPEVFEHLHAIYRKVK